MNLSLRIEKIQLFLLYLFPIAIVFSNALANFILIILSLVFVYYNKNYLSSLPNYLIYYVLLVLFFLIHPSNFYNFDKITFFKILGFLRFPLFFCFAYFFFKKDIYKKHILYLSYLITFLMVFLSLDIFFQFFYKSDIFGYIPGQWSSQLNDYQRYSGFFGDELIGGAYLYLNFLILILLIKKFYNIKKLKISLIFLALVIAIAVLLSGERVALFKFLLLYIFSFIILSQNKKLFVFLSLIILLFTTLVIFNQPILKKRLILSTLSEVGSLQNIKKNSYHFLHYKTGISIFRDNPFFGTGFKSFRETCKKYDNGLNNLKDRKAISSCSTHPHNFLIEILSDGGILGFSIFLIFLISLLKYLYLKKNYLLLFYLIVYFLPIIPTGGFFSSWINFNFWFILTFGILIHNHLILKNNN